jgi:hypothetical protein
MKSYNLHFNLMVISFYIQSAGVQSQNNKMCHCTNTFGAHCRYEESREGRREAREKRAKRVRQGKRRHIAQMCTFK